VACERIFSPEEAKQLKEAWEWYETHFGKSKEKKFTPELKRRGT